MALVAPHLDNSERASEARYAAIAALPQNDVDACERFYRTYGVDGDLAATMLNMQTDPDSRDELERVMRSWNILPPAPLTVAY